MTDYQRLIRECAMGQKVFHILQHHGDVLLVETRADVDVRNPSTYEVYQDGVRRVSSTSPESALRHWRVLCHG